ncbi:MAG: hypothetical protein MJY71_07240 [Bacteroidaceae bacterium]|nr:hypothetical protein [Bacteroidaceae bacterium]
MAKVKIVLDADVLIHFSEAGKLSLLPSILNEFDHIILSTVYEEIKSIQKQVDNQVYLLKNISIEQFAPSGEMRKEYAMLSSRFGKGESSCMAYCKYTNNVIGSSNLKDVKKYCVSENITYLTTLDFLYYAFVRGKLTKVECSQFIQEVLSNGSKLPVVDITTYTPSCQI